MMAPRRNKEREKALAGQPYTPGARGWMVAHTARTPSGRMLVAWWYGPGHGWGTTYGGLSDSCPRVWPTKFAAEQALRAIYGTPANWRGHEAVRVADAEAQHREQSDG